jgi:hypothetical protein
MWYANLVGAGMNGMSVEEIRQNPPEELSSVVLDLMKGRMAQGIEGGNRKKNAGHLPCS